MNLKLKSKIFHNKSVLITGGTGSFGRSFLKYIISKKIPFKRVVIYSRDEFKQSEMMKVFDPSKNKILRYFIGDIRDKDRLSYALENIDYVIHAAAMKQVPASEYNPIECIKTNILGAQNIIEACLEKNIKKVIALSTDKAASPVNLYGATKLCSDKLFVAANNFKGNNKTVFSIVRYGNVMGSRGSVIPIFLNYIEKNYFPITDNRMTRFNITLNEAIKFVLECFKIMKGGEIFVPKLPSIKITDLAKALRPKFKIKIIGLRPGEKLHEEMISSNESLNTIELSKFYVICPQSKLIDWDKNYYLKNFKNSKNCKQGFHYSSETNEKFLTVTDIKKILKINRFI